MQLPTLRPKRRVLAPHINLYPEDPFYDSIFGKALKWSLSVGRHIVIFTELVVIGSFLSRFVLDRQLSDLNKEIVQKQAVVESYGSLEDDFRALQLQTRDINSIVDDQGQYVVLEVLATLTPPEIRFTQISYSNGALALQGVALTNEALSNFIEGMRRNPTFSTVSISSIRSGDERDPSIQFSASARSTLVSAPAEESRSSPSRNETVTEEELL